MDLWSKGEEVNKKRISCGRNPLQSDDTLKVPRPVFITPTHVVRRISFTPPPPPSPRLHSELYVGVVQLGVRNGFQ